MKKYNLLMIISGGQTGADRAALDFALDAGIYCSGWCPKGRLSEDKSIPLHYPLIEANSSFYQHRTRLNVRDSDATLIFIGAKASKGTILTIRYCIVQRKSHFIFPISSKRNVEKEESLKKWLICTSPSILNIAGPRARESINVYDYVFRTLSEVIRAAKKQPKPDWPPKRPETGLLI